MTSLRLATRGSRLALAQAEWVRQRLLDLTSVDEVELVKVVSTGDTVRDRPLHELGGVGVFTKEVQQALLDGRADFAVHSLKDLPTQVPAHLTLVAVTERTHPFDVLVSHRWHTFDALPLGATLATSSLRRRAQLLRRRPDLVIVDIRGNIETRLRKLQEQPVDGIVLAEAGLARLGLTDVVTERFALDVMVPAVGQGALGIECRQDDTATATLLTLLNHKPTRVAVEAERSFLRALQGGCQVPIGGYAVTKGDHVELRGAVLSRDGTAWFEGIRSGPAEFAAEVGTALAQELLEQGADRLLQLCR